MALTPTALATDLKTAFSNSPDPALKALTDAHYDALAVCITNHIKRGSIIGLQSTVSGATASQTAPVLIT